MTRDFDLYVLENFAIAITGGQRLLDHSIETFIRFVPHNDLAWGATIDARPGNGNKFARLG